MHVFDAFHLETRKHQEEGEEEEEEGGCTTLWFPSFTGRKIPERRIQCSYL